MKIPYKQKLKDIKGTEVDVILGDFLFQVVTLNEDNQPVHKKKELALLARKILDEQDLSIEELATAKEMAMKYATVTIITDVEKLLEGTNGD